MKKALSLILLVAVMLTGCGAKAPKELNILAAASLKECMGEIQLQYEEANDIKLVISYGASGTLATQIEQGAPADYFISAGAKQMSQLVEGGCCDKAAAHPLLENKLALIVPKGEALPADLSALVNYDKIAIGDDKSVPAGQYAREALDSLKLTDKLSDKLVYAKDVREVLAWVETGNAAAGLVYETDAKLSDKVEIACLAPPGSHKAIVYPAAVMKNAENKKAAQAFDEYLSGDKAREIFIKYGFTPYAK